MVKASDNAYPSLLITEGTEPSAPAAGKQRLYIDSTTHKLKRTDSSGTDVTIESSGGGMTHTFIGYNTIGGTALTPVANTWYMTSVTLASAGYLGSIGIYCYENGGSPQVAALPFVGVWTESTGPKQFIAANGGEAADKMYPGNDTTPNSADGRWIDTPCGIYLPAATYWIGAGFIDVGSLQIVRDGSGSDRTLLSTGAWIIDADYPTATLTTTAFKYSIRGSVLS